MKKISVLLIISLLLLTCGCSSNSDVNSNQIKGLNFELTKRDYIEAPGWDRITQDNFPSIGFTKYTEKLAQGIFTDTFYSEDEKYGIETHTLYPRNQYSEKTMAKAIKSGELDMGFVDKLPSDNGFDPDLEYTLIGQDALIFFTRKENPVWNVSEKNLLKALNSKEKVKWSELSGDSAAKGYVNIAGEYCFPQGDVLLSKTLLDGKQPVRTITASEYSDLTAESYGSIVNAGVFKCEDGYVLDYAPITFLISTITQTYAIEDDIHFITVDGTEPMIDGSINKDYPYTINTYLVRKKGSQNETVDIIHDLLDDDSHLFYEDIAKIYRGSGILEKVKHEGFWELYKKFMGKPNNR